MGKTSETLWSRSQAGLWHAIRDGKLLCGNTRAQCDPDTARRLEELTVWQQAMRCSTCARFTRIEAG